MSIVLFLVMLSTCGATLYFYNWVPKGKCKQHLGGPHFGNVFAGLGGPILEMKPLGTPF